MSLSKPSPCSDTTSAALWHGVSLRQLWHRLSEGKQIAIYARAKGDLIAERLASQHQPLLKRLALSQA
jgi:hypothetical protein